MSELTRQQVRAAYTSFATGVTVVTAFDGAGRPCGMTASSLNPISLDPPLVSVALTHGSPNYDSFVQSPVISISILNERQSDLARHFAMPHDDKFAGVPLEDVETGVPPVIRDGVASMICETQQTFEVGDHTLLIARVVKTAVRENPPLIYHRGTFFETAQQAGNEVESRRQRATMVGFIVEDDDRVALMADTYASGDLVIPMARLVGGSSTSDAVSRAAQRIFKEEIEIDFLYSIVDVSDSHTCLVYRGRRLGGATTAQDVTWYRETELPWSLVRTRSSEVVLRRYFRERVKDQFGVYVSIGNGRIATMSAPSEWEDAQTIGSRG
ncbi:flavin reductase family protein [Leucobacter sp.]